MSNDIYQDVALNKFYVYAYLRSKDSKTAKAGTPYYFGKGKDNRAYVQHRKNGKGVHTPKDKSKIIFIEKDLEEWYAYSLEIFYIRWFGRIELNTGILYNKTDGGDGSSNDSDETRKKKSRPGKLNGMFGKHHTDEVKDAQSIRATGNKSRTGQSHSKATKEKMSTKAKNRKLKKCPHCGTECSGSNFLRWHGDNCKSILSTEELNKRNKQFEKYRKVKIICEYCKKELLPCRYNSNHGSNCSKNPNKIKNHIFES